MSLLTIGNVLSPHHETTSSSLKVCPKELTIQKRLDQFSISVVQECSAIKKGLLWEQQQNRFFFNRWKERFFILTTDYLTCFKKGSKKVGMSEMGSFVYKINLNDIKNLNWVDKKKNGVIGVQLANTVIFLWNDADTVLDEWMTVLQDSTLRTKDRRSEAIRKSSTLLPNMIASSSTKFLNTDMVKRTDSPNLVLSQTKTLIDNSLLNDIVPPPPPPRRYLRCLSTDLGKMTTSLKDDAKVMMTPSLSRNSNTTVQNSPNISKTIWNKPNLEKESRKSSDASSTASSLMSQSLRCKSSYAIQHSPLMTDSLTQLNHNHQQHITAKRLSALHQNETSNNSSSSSNYFQPADSEFTFVNSKATTFKTNLNPMVRGHHATTTDRNSNHMNHHGIRSNRISSSASLMLNHRRKGKCLLETPPPPVPPHRTHMHHF